MENNGNSSLKGKMLTGSYCLRNCILALQYWIEDNDMKLHQLTFPIVQLSNIYTLFPVDSGDPKKYLHLAALLSQCLKSSIPVLVPSTSCLIPPGGLLCDLLTGEDVSL